MIGLHLSTIGADAAALARAYGLGIEIADFSYAVNMDTDFPHWEALTHANLTGIDRRVWHGPFNELCPAAVEPLVVDVTRRRLEQAYRLAASFAVGRMVVHSGYVPHIYHQGWFIEQSVAFWRTFLQDKPADFALLLENTLEESPGILRGIVEGVGDPRMLLCLDIGHAGGVFSTTPVMDWVEACAPVLGHVHIHNNYHVEDVHNPPGDGLIDMEAAIERVCELQPEATFTAETEDMQAAVAWFADKGYLKENYGD